MFLIDKYSPKKYEDVLFNNKILEQLESMAQDDEIPHIILYGPHGSGKHTISKLFLNSLFDESVNTLSETTYTINGSGNTYTDVSIKHSNFHIVINPGNNNFDKYMIQNIVNLYCTKTSVSQFSSKHLFRVILINDVDKLSYYAQMSLRRTMEKYSKVCRFLMICNSVSKLIDPLKSRCVCVRVPLPSEIDLITTIMCVAHREKYSITLKQLNDILIHSENNVKTALWLLNMMTLNIETENYYVQTMDYIVELILQKDINDITTIRDSIYNILMTNVDGSTIICNLMNILIKNDNISHDKKIKIIENASLFESNLVLGRREIIHIDGFIVSVIMTLMNS